MASYFPPPGLYFPPPGLCTVNLIGDLRVAACNEEQGGSNQLQTALSNALQKMSIQVVSIPGAGAIEIQKQLDGLKSKADTVIVVWFLNELFDEQGILCSGESMEKALSKVKESACALAQSLLRFKHRMAVIGGSHRLWSVAEKFDGYVAEVADIVRNAGVHVDQRAGAYQDTMREQRHFINTPENFQKIVGFFVTCVRAVQALELEKYCPTSNDTLYCSGTTNSEGTALSSGTTITKAKRSSKTVHFTVQGPPKDSGSPCLLGRLSPTTVSGPSLLPGRLACLEEPGKVLNLLVPQESECAEQGSQSRLRLFQRTPLALQPRGRNLFRTGKPCA